MQSTWEHGVKYDLSESGLEALTLEDAVRDFDAIRGDLVRYANGRGRDAPRPQVRPCRADATRDIAPSQRVAAAWAMKDYTTIAPATLSDLLAEIALARREQLLKRARYLLNERWPILVSWAAAHAQDLHWVAPAAGAICFFGYSFPIESTELVDRLIRDWGTMVVPG